MARRSIRPTASGAPSARRFASRSRKSTAGLEKEGRVFHRQAGPEIIDIRPGDQLVHRTQVEIGGALADLPTIVGPFFDRLAEVKPDEDA